MKTPITLKVTANNISLNVRTGVNVTKLFVRLRENKLECLSLASIFSLV
jgi:hypothetical protein